MKKLKNDLCLLFICSLIFSCGVVEYDKYIDDSTFDVALDSAKKENKYLWVLFGSEANCGYSSEFLKSLAMSGVFEKYKDKFIFHVMDISKDNENSYYKYIILPTEIPNSYIFNNDGDIVSLYSSSKFKYTDIDTQLQKVINKRPSNPWTHRLYPDMWGRPLLNHINLLLRTNRLYLSSKDNVDSLIKAKNTLNSIAEADRNFYYYYLNTMIASGLKDSVLMDSCATLALKKFDSAGGSLSFANLQEKIKPFSKSYSIKSDSLPILSFEKEVISCGTLKRGEIKNYTLKFKNTGILPLLIISVSTSCDCIKIAYPKTPIKAGEQSEVVFTYDASIKGEFTRTVHFRSNASKTIQGIKLIGNCD